MMHAGSLDTFVLKALPSAGLCAASMTTTLQPRLASCQAVEEPSSPAPTTATRCGLPAAACEDMLCNPRVIG